MQCFSRVVIFTFGLINTLCFAQACRKDLREKNTPSSLAKSQTVGGVSKAWTQAIKSETSPLQALKPLEPSCVSYSFEKQNCDGNVACELIQDINLSGLTQEKAIQIALANNPELFAYYDNLELGYAELLEASLRQNPKIYTSRRYPSRPDEKVDKLYDTTASILDNFLIPLRQRAAQAEILVIESQVDQKVIDLVKEVQINWLDVKILELQIDKENLRVELKSIATDLVDLQYKAGNVSLLKARERDKYTEAQEKLKELLAELEIAREKLNRSLGLFGNNACYKLSGDVAWKNDPAFPDINILENIAIENRPDLEAIRREIYTLAQKAKLKEPWTYTNLRMGVSSERDSDGLTVTGPLLDIDLPVNNYGQGEVKKYNTLIAQAQKKLLAKAVEACSEVRGLLKAAKIYRSQLESYETILPDHAKQVALGQAHYNVMTLSPFALFDLKDDEAQALIEQIHALKKYSKAKIELLHAVGGSFNILGRKE